MQTTQYLFQHCPIGCKEALIPTAILLPEGPLMRCPECDQLLSQATSQRYNESLKEFDTAQGTLPDTRSEVRRSSLARRRLEKISRALGKTADQLRLLDVGCSSGAFLAEAARLGWKAKGVEPAPRAAEAARKSGCDVVTGTLEQASFEDNSFDAITLFEVIEHLTDPLAVARVCARILRPGGALMLGTGNAKSWTAAAMGAHWDYFHIDHHGGHVSFFNPRSISLLADRSGFAVQQLETRSVRFVEKGRVPDMLYRSAKILGEVLNVPAAIAGKGHDLIALLQLPADSSA